MLVVSVVGAGAGAGAAVELVSADGVMAESVLTAPVLLVVS
ncbi:MAG TPA: hypothetical protein VHR43_03645 [Gemmatimonadales bacterium]|nr:hypothetical protein [Gemmatimonadales bacterium]